MFRYTQARIPCARMPVLNQKRMSSVFHTQSIIILPMSHILIAHYAFISFNFRWFVFFFILFSFKIFVFLFTFDPIHSISTPKCMCALFYHCKLIMSTVVWAMFTLFFWLCIHHGSYRFITDLFIYFLWFSTWDATNKYQFLNKTLQIFLVFFRCLT